MTRPLKFKTAAELQAAVLRNQSNAAELELILSELRHRTTSKASDMQKSVRAYLKALDLQKAQEEPDSSTPKPHASAAQVTTTKGKSGFFPPGTLRSPFTLADPRSIAQPSRPKVPMTASDQNPLSGEQTRWLHSALAKLREKLIDLGKRNPLISFKHSERGASYLRVVDECPDQLFTMLRDDSMTFEPLPGDDRTPQDELTPDFKIAFERARLTDEIYLSAIEKLGDGVEDEGALVGIERELRMRVREALGLPRIAAGRTVDVRALAQAHGFDPSYDLHRTSDDELAEHHKDTRIRVLLTEERLDKRLKTIHDRFRSHMDERGLHTLFVVFGFVEWYEDETSDIALHAPLFILPAHLSKKLVRGRYLFSLSANDEDPQINIALIELLKRRFGVELPALREAESPESYFIRASAVLDQIKRFRLRRFVTIAVLPFPNMVLWQDLDPAVWPKNALESHPLLSQLMGASEGSGENGFLGDYPIDDDSFAGPLPPLVMDADVSQHSTLIDVARRRSLAVEGPPGTGKSQTITNIIAGALDQGQRVLFVAEKQAALDVVAKRLSSVGFGPLLLELHSERATKAEMHKSIDLRLNSKPGAGTASIEHMRTDLLEQRKVLRRYLTLLDQPLGALGRTAYGLMWREIHLRSKLGDDLVERIEGNNPVADPAAISAHDLKRSRDALDNISTKIQEIRKHYGELGGTHWYRARRLPPFVYAPTVAKARAAAETLGKLTELMRHVDHRTGIGLLQESELATLVLAMAELPAPAGCDDPSLRAALGNPDEARRLLADREGWIRLRDQSLLFHPSPLSIDDQALERAAKTLKALSRIPASLEAARSSLEALKDAAANLDQLRAAAAALLDRFGLDIGQSTIVQIVAICRAILALQAASPEVIALKTGALLEEGSRIVIRNEASQAVSLAGRVEVLAAIFKPAAFDADTTQLMEWTELFASAGIFKRMLSSRYKASWRVAGRLFVAPVDREEAASALNDLILLLNARRTFVNESPARMLFGPMYWRGDASAWGDLIAAQQLAATLVDDLAAVDLYDAAEALWAESAVALRRISNWATTIATADTLRDPDIGRLTFDKLAAAFQLQILEVEAVVGALEPIGLLPSTPLVHGEIPVTAVLTNYRNADDRHRHKPDDALFAWYDGPDTPLQPLHAAVAHMVRLGALGLPESLKVALCNSHQPASLSTTVLESGERLLVLLHAAHAAMVEFSEDIETPIEEFLGITSDETELDVALAHKIIAEAASDEAGLRLCADLGRYLAEANERGCGFVQAFARTHDAPPESLADLYEFLVVQSVLRAYLEADGAALARLGGINLDQARSRFREIDKQLHIVEAQRILNRRLRDQVPIGTRTGPVGGWTDRSLIEREIAKSTRHIPIRDLTLRAGSALLALKPVWLMSPTSAAQYIRPGSMRFDIVVIDEASQMRPEFAIGAIARGGQLIVVGDSNQLPPSDFFQTTAPISNPDEEDEEDFTIDTESILDLANTRIGYKRRLSWHYRSQHESLIQFSNRRFYDRKLIVFPSPTTDDPLLGVKHRYVGGIYQASINQKEAEEVIREAVSIMLSRPQLSMGIATMNVQQRDLIKAEFDRLATEEPAVEDYRRAHADTIEPFFIKNIENVQGDERDIILISTVYGPDKDGHVFQRFGPLASSVGHRRLNVLVTRAKQSTRIFTSLHPSDIKITENSKEGVMATQAYLQYAAGGATFDDAGGGEADSDFEIFVAERLRGADYEVVHQVGVEGFRIDLGVRHASYPLGFIAGIECDGASYHSGLTVRDRDKIRQGILEGLGWKIHRIWSTDWFADPEREMRRLLVRLEGWRDAAAEIYDARRRSGDIIDDDRELGSVDAPTVEELSVIVASNDTDLAKALPSAEPGVAQSRPTEPRVPEGKHRQLDDIDWYERVIGTLFEVWPDQVFGGEIEVMSRATAGPRLYAGALSIQRTEYLLTVAGSGETLRMHDLYAAVRKIAHLAREQRQSPAQELDPGSSNDRPP